MLWWLLLGWCAPFYALKPGNWDELVALGREVGKAKQRLYEDGLRGVELLDAWEETVAGLWRPGPVEIWLSAPWCKGERIRVGDSFQVKCERHVDQRTDEMLGDARLRLRWDLRDRWLFLTKYMGEVGPPRHEVREATFTEEDTVPLWPIHRERLGIS